MYFFQLPRPLQDPAVNAELLNSVVIEGNPYWTLKITFDQEGGGEVVSPQDQGGPQCHLQHAGGGACQQGQGEARRAGSSFKEPRKKSKDKEEL